MMKKLKSKIAGSIIMALALMLLIPTMASAHCDTMDGPTAKDGLKAIETNNVNYVLKWVAPEHEQEISQIFALAMKVRQQSPEAKDLADKYFLENLIRIHRAGEGAPYTGLKPAGTPIDEVVQAADKSIEVGNLSPLENLVPQDRMAEVKERFEKVMSLKDFDVNDVKAGREYIEAYVSFFHYAEGEEEGHAAEHAAEAGHDDAKKEHAAEAEHDDAKTENATEPGSAAEKTAHTPEAETFPLIPWALAGVFSLTTVILGVAYFKKDQQKK